MFDDEKIKLIRTMPEGDSIALVWIQILCLAGRINDGGWVYMGQNLAYSDEMLATILGHPLNTMRVALSTLEQFGMIDIRSDGRIDVINWEKHQSTDKMARIAAQTRERQQRHYYRTKLREMGVNVDEAGFTNDPEELRSMYESMDDEPNVRLTLPNATEVRSKKKEERSKKKEVNNIEQEKPANKLAEKQLQDDFEKLWSLYPNKKGKAIALRAYKRAIKSGVTNKDIQTGIVNYKKEIEIKKTEPEYIAHGSTWFNQQRWGDDYDFTPPKPPTNYRGRSQHQEIIPEFMKGDNLQQSNESESEPMESEEELRKRLAEVFSEE